MSEATQPQAPEAVKEAPNPLIRESGGVRGEPGNGRGVGGMLVTEPDGSVAIVKLRVPPDRLIKPNVAIVGFTDHRAEAFNLPRDEWEVWGLNELHRYHPLPLWDRWFEIHNVEDLKGDPEHLKALAGFDIPVYMQQHEPSIPPSFPFPKEEVEAECGAYMTSSPAWMIGLAIAMGAQKIHLYGIDMAQETEYAEQRPCVEYLLGMARGRGIGIYVPPTSDLLHAIGQYGFGTIGTGIARKLNDRLSWLHRQDNQYLAQLRDLDAQREKMEAEYRAKREQLLCQRFQVFGAIQDSEYIKRSWAVPGEGKAGEPTPDRTQDPRTGIVAPVGDTREAA